MDTEKSTYRQSEKKICVQKIPIDEEDPEETETNKNGEMNNLEFTGI